MIMTDSLDLVTQALIDKLNANIKLLRSTDGKASLYDSLLASQGSEPTVVYYGDQEKLPVTPCVCVEPSARPRELNGVSYTSTNEFTVYLMFYHSRVQGEQLTRKQIQQISEVAETLIHQDPQLGGLLVHGFCSLNESGYVYRNNTMYRTNRVTYLGMSRTRLR